MTRSYEPAADVALDGTEPPFYCIDGCGRELSLEEGVICPACEDDRLAMERDDDGGRMDWAFERERDR